MNIHFTKVLRCFSSASRHRGVAGCFTVAVGSAVEFTRSSDSAIVAIKVVIVTGLNYLAGLAMQNYLVAITYSNSEVSQRTIIAIAGQSLPFEVAAASEGS